MPDIQRHEKTKRPRFDPDKQQSGRQPWWDEICDWIADGHTFEFSCAKVGITTRHFRATRRKYKEFAEQVQDAIDECVDLVTEQFFQIALHGVERKKFYKGDPIIDPETGKQYVEREYDMQAMWKIMCARKPETYGNRVTVDNQHSGAIQILEDTDWYGNADRLPPKATPASITDSSG